MSYLTEQQHALVAVGAALASNCIPCIKFHIRKGLLAGLSSDVIAEAIEVAEKVRQVPADNVRTAATAALDRRRAGSGDAGAQTACGGAENASKSTHTAGSPCCGQRPNRE